MVIEKNKVAGVEAQIRTLRFSYIRQWWGQSEP